ncbi:MAG: putative quinol monooxygenase [Rhodopirellula sp. JB055]|uniref:putative quinol monooxygenase n=1 Tax=Rhodopirellula sp. JB055 TaxID=3342846 RepID=UPI00370A09DC
MAHLTVVAHITAKEDQIDLVKSELLKLIPPTLSEPGCVNYDMHQDNENPAHFMFHENWESVELWQQHTAGQPLKDFGAATEGALEELKVYQLTRVS